MGNLIEASSSGRAKCRACRQAIAKGALRFGERVANPYGEGEATQWYHLRCAALRLPEKLKEALSAAEVPGLTEFEAMIDLALSHPKLPWVVRLEASPTGRARCQQCRQVIAKDAQRVALERLDDGMPTSAGYLHVACAEAEFGAESLARRLASVVDAQRDEMPG